MGTARNWVIIGLVSALSTIAIWFIADFGVVMRNYDGPLYIVVAKTWYNFSSGNVFEFPLSNEYYAAHFPLYPALIFLLGNIWNFPAAMLLVTLSGSVMAGVAFYGLARKHLSERVAFWASLLFLFLPARYFVVRSVGSPEPWFIFFIISSVNAFTQKRFWQSGVWGAMATLTKSPGVLLFAAYLVCAAWKKLKPQTLFPISLIPIALVGLFGIYQLQYNDFFAYFHSGDNIHLQAIPFKVFDSSQAWVGEHWLEDVIWVYLVGTIGLIALLDQKKYEMASFVAVFLISIFFVSHRDVSRYALPIMPFVLLALARLATEKQLKIIFWVMLLPVYMYSINFILNNTMPISDWTPLI